MVLIGYFITFFSTLRIAVMLLKKIFCSSCPRICDMFQTNQSPPSNNVTLLLMKQGILFSSSPSHSDFAVIQFTSLYAIITQCIFTILNIYLLDQLVLRVFISLFTLPVCVYILPTFFIGPLNLLIIVIWNILSDNSRICAKYETHLMLVLSFQTVLVLVFQ